MRTQSKYKNCIICGEDVRGRYVCRGRCSKCYAYLKRHGIERPTNLSTSRPRPQDRAPCSNCKKAPVLSRGMCRACYAYWWKHRKPRPARRYRDVCWHCKRPLNSETCSMFNGWCNNCYVYKRKYGRDRSKEILQKYAPLGWCDCGQPAVTLLEYESYYIPDQLMEPLRLCIVCAKNERDLDEAEESTTQGQGNNYQGAD